MNFVFKIKFNSKNVSRLNYINFKIYFKKYFYTVDIIVHVCMLGNGVIFLVRCAVLFCFALFSELHFLHILPTYLFYTLLIFSEIVLCLLQFKAWSSNFNIFLQKKIRCWTSNPCFKILSVIYHLEGWTVQINKTCLPCSWSPPGVILEPRIKS